MGKIETTNIHNHLVMRDETDTWRWYDAFGPNVTKYLQEFNGANWQVDDTTHDPSPNWTCNITEGAGTTKTDLTDVAGGALLITTGTNEDDGMQMQLGHEADGNGESVDLSGSYPLYLSARFKVEDADQTDVLVGFCVTDTDCLGGVTDGIYFRSVDASATLYFVTEKDSTESATSVATLADDTYVRVEFYYDGDTVSVYVDGALVTTVADSAATFPNNELLRLTLEFLTGEGNANTLTMTHLRYIHINS